MENLDNLVQVESKMKQELQEFLKQKIENLSATIELAKSINLGANLPNVLPESLNMLRVLENSSMGNTIPAFKLRRVAMNLRDVSGLIKNEEVKNQLNTISFELVCMCVKRFEIFQGWDAPKGEWYSLAIKLAMNANRKDDAKLLLEKGLKVSNYFRLQDMKELVDGSIGEI